MKISLLFFSIVSGLAIAMVALMPLIPQKSIGKSFFRLICFLSLILLLPFAFFNPYEGFQLPFQKSLGIETPLFLLRSISTVFLLFGVALFFLLGFFFFKKGKDPVNPYLYSGTVILGLIALAFDSTLYLPREGLSQWTTLLIPLHLFSSAALFGSVMFAMLLGHWYLVQFDLDKKLLERVCLAYNVTLGIRTLLIAISLLLTWKSQPQVLATLVNLSGHGLFFWSRMIVGILLPIVLGFMIYSTAKMGANQACTGLLYIAVLFVIMGEMISRYVFFLKGIPL